MEDKESHCVDTVMIGGIWKSHHMPIMAISWLYFRVQSGDKILAEHLQSAGHCRNALYTSIVLQDHTESTYRCLWSHNLYNHSERSPCCLRFFCHGAWTKQHAANEEQLAVCVRYHMSGPVHKPSKTGSWPSVSV